MSFVIDASVTVSWAINSDSNGVSYRALRRAQETFASTPLLWQFEVASALRKMLLDGRLSASDVPGYLADLATLDIREEVTVQPVQLLLELADQTRLSIYDAAYLELALRTSQPLATLDGDLAKAARLASVKLLV